jgi:hypothetical protein
VFLPVGVQFDLSTIDTSKITTPFVSAVTVDDVKSVTTSEIASASDDNNLRIAILDYIRRFSPYSLVNDFSISVYSDFTNFNNVTFTNDCYIRISASDDSNTLSNSVVVPLALTVNEPIISNTYRASLVANYNLTGSTIFNLHGHANVAVRITTIDISFK